MLGKHKSALQRKCTWKNLGEYSQFYHPTLPSHVQPGTEEPANGPAGRKRISEVEKTTFQPMTDNADVMLRYSLRPLRLA